MFPSNKVNIIDEEDDNTEVIGTNADDNLQFIFDICLDLRYHLVTAVYINVSFSNDMASTCINITTLPNGLFPVLWCQSLWAKSIVYQSPDIKSLFLTEVQYQEIKFTFLGFTVVLSSNDNILNQTEEKADLILEVKVPKPSKKFELLF